jgi:SAM-dependent methyltransferase
MLISKLAWMGGMSWNSVWEQIFSSRPWGKYPGEDLIRFIARNFYQVPDRGSVKIVELGCGPGANIWYLAREGFSFCGIEGSASAVAIAEARLNEEVPGWRARGKFITGDLVMSVPKGELFDAAIDVEAACCNSFADAQRIYDAAAAALKPNGKLFVRTFATGTWGEGTGRKNADKEWFCAEGPLAGTGLGRFTDKDDLPVLLRAFNIDSIGLITREDSHSGKPVREWIVSATKKKTQVPKT